MGRYAKLLRKMRKGPKPKRVPVADLVCPSCRFTSKAALTVARLGTVKCRCGTPMTTRAVIQPPPSDQPEPPPNYRTKEGYALYLQTDWWRHKRKHRIAKAGGKCEKCGDSAEAVTLHVHHLTYERIGAERDGDLEVLCEACHHKEHPGWK